MQFVYVQIHWFPDRKVHAYPCRHHANAQNIDLTWLFPSSYVYEMIKLFRRHLKYSCWTVMWQQQKRLAQVEHKLRTDQNRHKAKQEELEGLQLHAIPDLQCVLETLRACSIHTRNSVMLSLLCSSWAFRSLLVSKTAREYSFMNADWLLRFYDISFKSLETDSDFSGVFHAIVICFCFSGRCSYTHWVKILKLSEECIHLEHGHKLVTRNKKSRTIALAQIFAGAGPERICFHRAQQ